MKPSASNTQFVSNTGAILVFNSYPSVTEGVFIGFKKDGEATPTFHVVDINPASINQYGEMPFTARTARMSGKFKITNEYVILGSWAYHMQDQPFAGEMKMYDWATIDRSGYPAYECKYFLKGRGDGLIVYVIAPPNGFYDQYVVFAGTGEKLYEVPQYRTFEAFRVHAENTFHVTFTADFVSRTGVKYPAGDYTVRPGDGTWNNLLTPDYDIVVNGMEVTLRQKR